MTNKKKTCPACGGGRVTLEGTDHTLGAIQKFSRCQNPKCRLVWLLADDLIWDELHKALRTLPDGTELEPGKTYSVTRVDHTHGNTNVAYFTIPNQEAPDA